MTNRPATPPAARSQHAEAETWGDCAVLGRTSATSSLLLKPVIQLAQAAAPEGTVYSSSSEDVARSTIGWAGEPGPNVPFTESHRRQVHLGMQAMDRIAPGFRQRFDSLLSPDVDPKLKQRQDALINEQSSLLAKHGRLLSMPDDKLKGHEQKQKAELNGRIEGISKAYDQVERDLQLKSGRNVSQARDLAGAFLERLRDDPQVRDVSDRVQLDPTAVEQMKKDGLEESTLHAWVNEFHHQTGLPAPTRLRLKYTEKRPCYQSAGDYINIGEKFSKRLALHEIAHRIEYKFPEISMASKSWVRARCEKGGFSDEPVSLQKLVPQGTYKPDEMALEDSFADPYVGKLYPDMATEVLSMGLEHFSDDSRFVKLYRQDPEHLFLTLGAIELLKDKKGAW